MATDTQRPTGRRRKIFTPFTVDHWRAYTEKIILDTDEYWDAEGFQIECMKPILAGVRETWIRIPEGNGKTTLMAGFGLYHLDFTRFPWVPILASSRDQAEIMAVQAFDMIRRTGWEAEGKHRSDATRRFRIYEGYRRIAHVRNGGRGLKVYAADTDTGDGGIPTLVLCDELHRWQSLSTYRLWKGKLRKRHGQIAGISTAGEPGGEFEEQCEAIRQAAVKTVRRGSMTRHESPNMTMIEWQVADPEKISDMREVKKANPFSGITTESLKEEFDSPTTDIGDWKRLKCNVPSRTISAAITDVEWDKSRLLERIPEGEHVGVGYDVAWKLDTTALAPLWEGPDYRLIDLVRILVPPRDGSTMHPDAVKLAFEEIMEFVIIDFVVVDMERAEDVCAWLEDEHSIEVIDHTQGNAQAAEDYDAFMKALRTAGPKGLRHAEDRDNGHLPGMLSNATVLRGDRPLRQHVMNAIARALPSEKRRFDRPSQSRAKRKQQRRVIDGLTAAAMVNQYVDSQEAENDEPLVAWAGGGQGGDTENPWAPATNETLPQGEYPFVS